MVTFVYLFRDKLLQCIVAVRSFLRMLKICWLTVCKLDLSSECLTQLHGVLDHGFNLHWNIPLTSTSEVDFSARRSSWWIGVNTPLSLQTNKQKSPNKKSLSCRKKVERGTLNVPSAFWLRPCFFSITHYSNTNVCQQLEK